MLLTIDEMRRLEHYWHDELRIPASVTVAEAGTRAFAYLAEEYAACRRWLILAGAGNNGADAYVVARLAKQAGFRVRVAAFGAPRTEAARLHAALYRACGGEVCTADMVPEAILAGSDLIVEGIIGIGAAGALREPLPTWFAAIEAGRTAGDWQVAALDVPAGVQADTGSAAAGALQADCTLELAAAKVGLHAYPHMKTVTLPLALPLPPDFHPAQEAVNWETIRPLLAARPRDAHKGTQGHVAVVAGSVGMEGAALLAAQAALRAGAGKVTLYTPQAVARTLAGRVPELMVQGVGTGDRLQGDDLAAVDWDLYDAVAIGCGIGRSEETGAWLRRLLKRCKGIRVLDADALYFLREETDVLGENCILTPHIGEWSRLLGEPAAAAADRLQAVRKLAARYGCTAVLKGAATLIARPDGLCRVNTTGNPGLATAGSGDTLTGIIAALAARGFSPFDAAAYGVCWHGAAGDYLARSRGYGFLAGEIGAALGTVLGTERTE
ncbi:MAG: NAD(P)H-hydrate dehydratase [Veillonellaceae bacterium]|nr:NAD(P)H-hydrate dehydratase [Veillonellaceae bacterium]